MQPAPILQPLPQNSWLHQVHESTAFTQEVFYARPRPQLDCSVKECIIIITIHQLLKIKSVVSEFVENLILNEQSFRTLKMLSIRINVVNVMLWHLHHPGSTHLIRHDCIGSHNYTLTLRERQQKFQRFIFIYFHILLHFLNKEGEKYLYISKTVSLNLPNHPFLL